MIDLHWTGRDFFHLPPDSAEESVCWANKVTLPLPNGEFAKVRSGLVGPVERTYLPALSKVEEVVAYTVLREMLGRCLNGSG